MPLTLRAKDSGGLSPGRTVASPGSSVFDLPTQLSNGTQLERRSAHLQEVSGQLTVDDLKKSSPRFLVISGGTGGNSICSAFGDACYVLPVSDDGGSSSEIIRVLGGPSVGDIRSRLVRLIPPAPPSSPLDAIRGLLAFRLPADDREARDQWREIVEGKSSRWVGIPNDRKETIRGFLVHFESELLKRAHKNFSFVNGSIGNFFLAAAQSFFRSLPSAIFLFSSITNSQANILPVVVTNHTVTIAAELENGERLVGQCEISHPVSAMPLISVTSEPDLYSPVYDLGEIMPQQHNVMFDPQSKEKYDSLPSRIMRLYYLNAYGHEVHPSPNPDYISNLASSDVLVYSCGSLWTSIIPCLSLRGVATAIARSRSCCIKILLLNSQNDRETENYTAVDYISAITQTLNTNHHTQLYSLGNAYTTYPISAFVTHLIYLRGTTIKVDVGHITTLGVKCVAVDGLSDPQGVPSKFVAASVRQAIDEILDQADTETDL
ncbi:hypothetical protein PILCRDRAFT_67540 [Piloderma croceum F 1598]|uniref:Uncharacterized protein n=1 Tax=Piloderma croceum (strain F 1598) TaxID=765440 RepID=A0A0C3C544_PILCF|nr:hypothetical protein PILCRDRAFT_67540 [Piloderma croceum F 1598]